ncbi:MAG: NAD(P)-dependent oxidoreductase [Chloroherpetonaceae bacterium]|nr:NAD(P)-dependent oxidoreductase [Chthonomonadaceae bacterium]MDW8208980.1 NAD(P)-dependent oxidoreductase [Chloroherpetonaceae bacterium]
MRILVAGATGVMGRALLPRLQEAGHTVFGLARTPHGLLDVSLTGATPVRGDVLDADATLRAVREARPEAIVNLTSAIPRRLRVHPEDWAENDRVRVEGTANLLAAAHEMSVRLFVQSSAGYVCAPRGEDWIDEEAPLSTHPFLQATLRMEEQVRTASVPGVLLRFAALMAADAWHTQQSVAALRRGLLPIIGDGSAYLSLIHVDDAVQAVLCALARPDVAAGRIYNVADSAPARMQEVLPFAARVLGAPPPRTVPTFLARMLAGALTLEVFTASYRLSNARIRRELGFEPRYPTYQEIWTQIAQVVSGQDFVPSTDLRA